MVSSNITTTQTEYGIRSSTVISSGIGKQKTYPGDVTELTERVETLTNETGHLRTEFQDRPIIFNAQIRDLNEATYKLCEPIFITIEKYPSEDEVIATYPEINVFGVGVTELEAIVNLKQSILDLYEELDQASTGELGDLPLSWKNILTTIIERVESI